MKVTGENLTEAIVLLKNKMCEGVAEFVFIKKDGTERKARGTLDVNVMGEDNMPKGTGTTYSDTTTRYFDVDSDGWRSFNNGSLLEIYE